jgi:hypothetical protein
MGMRSGTWSEKSVSLMTAVKELSKYKLDLVEYRRSDARGVGLNQQANIHFSVDRLNKNRELSTGFSVHK